MDSNGLGNKVLSSRIRGITLAYDSLSISKHHKDGAEYHQAIDSHCKAYCKHPMKWMNTVAGSFAPKSRMGKVIVYTYSLLPRLSRYILDGRYNIDNNGVENAIRPLALGRLCFTPHNLPYVGNHDAAVRAAIVYSLFACCKAHDVEIRPWLEDTLKRIPTEKDITMLLRKHPKKYILTK